MNSAQQRLKQIERDRLARLAERGCEGSRGLQPTDQPEIIVRRGATAEQLPSPEASLKRRSATQTSCAPIRGLKPTATVTWSLRDPRTVAAFTLIEILIAVAAFAIVLAAINTVFYSALRLRNSTTEAIEKALPMEHALGVMKRDLANMVLPGGTMSGTFQTASTSNSVAGQSSPNFYTASGVIDETSPWAEVHRVSYLLVASTNRTQGKDLVRAVSRNLLPSLQDQSEQEWLMTGVQALTFLYHDGAQWKDSWDSTIENTSTGMSNGLPTAAKVQLQLATENSGGSRGRSRELPIELVVPIVVQQRTTQTQQVAAGGTQ